MKSTLLTSNSTLSTRFHLILPHLGLPSGIALDIGCGDCSFANLLSTLGFARVFAVDLASPNSINSLPDVSYIQTDALSALRSFDDSTLDFISLFDVLEHIDPPDINELLFLVFAKLKSSGVLVLQYPNPSSPFFSDIFYGDLTHKFSFSTRLIQSLLQDSGFNPSNITIKGVFPPVNSVIRLIRFIIFSIYSILFQIINLAETGSFSSVSTRVCIVIARKE